MISRPWLLSCAFSLFLCAGAGAASLYSFVAEYDGEMPLKWTTGLDMSYQDSTVDSLFEIVGNNTDPAGAVAYLERISSSPERDAALAGIVQQWIIGQPETAIEWLTNLTDGPRDNLPTRNPDRGDDGRLDRGERPGRESTYAGLPAVPEPTTAILAGLGCVALLGRRRSA